MDHYLRIENVGMTFDTKKGPFVALTDIDLEIHKGEFVTLIGHSGCGKSTLLNLISGLNVPTSGYLFLSGRQISGPGPDRGVIFQNHSLLPWLTCFENAHLAGERVFAGQGPKARLKERVQKALELGRKAMNIAQEILDPDGDTPLVCSQFMLPVVLSGVTSAGGPGGS